jgi:protein-S-isoprenylcysteine O-methyltransferase Ste14
MGGRSTAEILRLALLFTVLALLVALSHPARWSVIGGAPFVVAGELIRIWAAGHLFKTRELITSGPYRWTRNPLYLGRLLIFTGVGVMAWFSWPLNVIVLVAGWLVFFGYYLPRKERIEPARLLETHGEKFRSYFSAAPALFPTRRPYPDNGERWRWERFRCNREGLTALGLLAVVAILALRAWRVIP